MSIIETARQQRHWAIADMRQMIEWEVSDEGMVALMAEAHHADMGFVTNGEFRGVLTSLYGLPIKRVRMVDAPTIHLVVR